MIANQTKWDWEIKPQTSWFGTSLKELVSYKDLLLRLVRKDFLASYQQTLLGPFWIILQPILTVLTYVLVFSKVIGLSTEGVPSFLYYLTGITLWSLFSDLFLNVSNTFAQNIPVFSKVYFPRIIAPLSVLLLHLLRFLIQLLLLIAVLLYYYFTNQVELNFSHIALSLPVIIITAGMGLGAGIIFSILTAKYKDLFGLLNLFIRLLMFVCPIFYSIATVPQKVRWIVNLNPLSPLFELFRFAFIGKGQASVPYFIYSFIAMLVLVVGGILLFNKMGDKLIDVA